MNDQDLRQRLDNLEQQLAALQGQASQSPASAPSSDNLDRSSRRAWLTRAAVTLGAVGLAGATTGRAQAQTKPPTPAKAPTVDVPWLLGVSNSASTRTYLTNSAGAVNKLLHLDDTPSVIETDPTSNQTVSLLVTNNYDGVSGARRDGVYAHSKDGVGLVADGRWPLLLKPRITQPTNADTGGNSDPTGALYYEASLGINSLWCSHGPDGWRRVSTSSEAGCLQPLTPVRILDTRPSGNGVTLTGFDAAANTPITAGALPDGVIRGYRVAGHFNVINGARALLINVTIVDSGATGGYVSVAGVNPPPAGSATLVPSGAAPFIANNFAFTRLDANGNIFVRNVGASRHVIIDCTGFYW